MASTRRPAPHNKRRRKRRRFVFIIARPLTIAGGAFYFLSEGKAPLCHWGLLVTVHNPSVIKAQWDAFIEGNDPSALKPWGTLFELCRLPGNKISHHKLTNFSLKEWLTWGAISYAYVGRTGVSDEVLSAQGIL
jgi:hypothetical protein